MTAAEIVSYGTDFLNDTTHPNGFFLGWSWHGNDNPPLLNGVLQEDYFEGNTAAGDIRGALNTLAAIADTHPGDPGNRLSGF
jgi:hypothetical protein